MEEAMGIFEEFPNREAFECYWREHYVPVTYDDVSSSFKQFVTAAGGHIYLSDYEENGCVSKADFKENLSQEARFMFEDGLTEAFYEKNPQLYEMAFALYEEEQLTGDGDASIARIFHDTFRALYEEFLDRLYEEALEK